MHNRFPLYLPNKRTGVLILPTPLTEEELGMLEEQIQNAIWVMKETAIVATTEPQQPAAIGRGATCSEYGEAERKPGRTKLVYDKTNRAIVKVTEGEQTDCDKTVEE